MRNAATFEDDFDDAPARKPSRKPRARKSAKKGRRFPVDLSKLARYAAIGMSATLAIGIVANALILQKGHHPAPLFGKALTLADSAPRPVPPLRPAVEAPAPAPTAADATTGTVPVPPAKLHRAAAPPEPTTKPGEDPIGRLLKGTTPSAPADKTDTKTVLGVQKALLKLGFVVKPSGTMGPMTRKAIEAFEKDRHLPVRGEITHRLVKIISAESGLKID